MAFNQYFCDARQSEVSYVELAKMAHCGRAAICRLVDYAKANPPYGRFSAL
jgi:hypothetical protein